MEMVDVCELRLQTQATKQAPAFNDMNAILAYYAVTQPSKTALIYLKDGEEDAESISYGEFHLAAKRFATGLRQHVNKGDRVITLFQSSIDFAIAFWGCLYAGVLAVPLPVPGRRESDWHKLHSVAKDAGALYVAVQDKLYERLHDSGESLAMLQGITLLPFSRIVDQDPVIQERVSPCDPVFIQYTSGSTGAPKGVLLTHRNLIENQKILFSGFDNSNPGPYVSWLPLFHDMGLIGNFMQALYIGQPFIFMSPNSFLQKPLRWLKAISHFKARVSGAPNFAYDLCVERLQAHETLDIDLSSWQVAFNGAEPVRAGTLQRFQRAFARFGLPPSALYPCYGTAESTLIISGGRVSEPPIIIAVNNAEYEKGNITLDHQPSSQSRLLVSSGQPLIHDSIRIVDSKNHHPLPDRQIGEIWLSSPCNAIGYWEKPALSKSTFENTLFDAQDERKFLNTGDLGFLHEGHIYVTGRSKDVLIFNGRNIYPQDIEAITEQCHPALRAGRCAAISREVDDQEVLILVHEIDRKYIHHLDEKAVFSAIRSAVNKHFKLHIYAIYLLSPASIPMTSSGKIRRSGCKQLVAEGSNDILHTDILQKGTRHESCTP